MSSSLELDKELPVTAGLTATPEALVTSDAEHALNSCNDFLATDAIRHNIIWSVLTSRASNKASGRYAWASDSNRVVGLALQSPLGLRLTLTPMSAYAMQPIATALFEDGALLPGVTGAASTVARFAGVWSEVANVGAMPVGAERLYVADETTPVKGVAGHLRQATVSDIQLMSSWLRAADLEIGDVGGDPAAVVRSMVSTGSYWVWDLDGVAVSMAGATPAINDVTRIKGVYTPPEHRGRGYAAACVSAVGKRATYSGVTSMLYTDLSNPTSNGLYRRIGFRAVDEIVHYDFTER